MMNQAAPTNTEILDRLAMYRQRRVLTGIILDMMCGVDGPMWDETLINEVCQAAYSEFDGMLQQAVKMQEKP